MKPLLMGDRAFEAGDIFMIHKRASSEDKRIMLAKAKKRFSSPQVILEWNKYREDTKVNDDVDIFCLWLIVVSGYAKRLPMKEMWIGHPEEGS